MTKAVNTEAFEKATGTSWPDWLAFLDSNKAKDLSHAEITKLLTEKGVSNWWSQGITVAYEQHIGRRQPGQRSNGKYQVTVSKTVEGSMDDALKKWLEVTKGKTTFSDVSVSREPTTSAGGKFRYWHCGLADGTRLSMSIYEKDNGKAVIGLGHEDLESTEQVEHWRAYWKSQLNKLS